MQRRMGIWLATGAAGILVGSCSRSSLFVEGAVGAEPDGSVSIAPFAPDSGGPGDDASGVVEADAEPSPVADAADGGETTVADASLAEAETGSPCIGTVWPVADGGNGHCYRAVSVPSSITWDDASAAAIAAGGHLVTISSAGENAFVFDLTATLPGAWGVDSVGGNQGPWLGGRKIGSTWTWVPGEPWVYTDWAAGEPSGTYSGTIEDRLQYRGEDGTLQPRQTWNDEGNGGFEGLPRSYVIEFEP